MIIKQIRKIADYVGFTGDRQGRYYRLAAEILGITWKNDNNNANLTQLGEKLIV